LTTQAQSGSKRRRATTSALKAPRITVRLIESWQEYTSLLSGWSGFRNWCFRGQASEQWGLQSSLSRHVTVSRVSEKAWLSQESRMRRIFERKSHLFLTDPPAGDELEWLALMQHHGAPTRLLDFTWSPFAAAFFALERATDDAAVWALNLPLLWSLHERYKCGGVDVGRADPRDLKLFEQYYLPNSHRFVWQGDPFRMPQRVVAQSGTFLVTGHLGVPVEEILESYPGTGDLLVKFVFKTATVRAQAMASLYSMNITHATLFPGLDGLARSMAYEFEYSWEIDVKTNRAVESLVDPRLPSHVLAKR
jgi:FRG domain